MIRAQLTCDINERCVYPCIEELRDGVDMIIIFCFKNRKINILILVSLLLILDYI